MNKILLVSTIATNYMKSEFSDLKLVTPVSSPLGGYKWSVVQVVFTSDNNELLSSLKNVIAKYTHIKYIPNLKQGMKVSAEHEKLLSLPKIHVLENQIIGG